jgi:hypothetical protein
VTALAPLLGLVEEVPDHRRGQGQLYKLPHVLLFSILAIVTLKNPSFIRSVQKRRRADVRREQHHLPRAKTGREQSQQIQSW